MEPSSTVAYIVVTVLVALIAASPGVFAIWRQRRKTDAEADKSSADAAAALITAATAMASRWEGRVKQLECDLESLKKRVRVLERDNDALLRGASRLEGQVVSLGHEPVWRVAELRNAEGDGS